MKPTFILLLALGAAPAAAAVVEVGPSGFVSENSGLVAKPPAAVWAAVVQVARWWDPAHSYSGKAANLSFEAKAGGQWREEWPGGSVLHGTAIAVMPPRLLRLDAALGPLQGMPLRAVLNIELKPEGSGTRLTMRYRVGGPVQNGFPDLAAPVDGVMSGGFARLVRLATSGQAEETR